MGIHNESARQLLTDLGRRISESSGDARETSFLFQRISVLMQRFNAVLLHDSLPVSDFTDWWSYPLCICLILNSLGSIIIIIIIIIIMDLFRNWKKTSYHPRMRRDYYTLWRHWGSTYTMQSYTVDKTIKQKHHPRKYSTEVHKHEHSLLKPN